MMFLRKSSISHIMLIVLAISYAYPVWADKSIGTFSAQQSCPAYVSKKKLTNPDNVRIMAGREYDAIEVNKPDQPDWYRVIVPTANPRERWVNAECGQAQMTGVEPEHNNSCSTAGQADSYVLALSWQPAFCELKPQKPECQITDPTVYQAKHFTLHGLWPNKKSCGTHYAFCGEIKGKREDFCDYPGIELDPTSQAALAEVMPSVSAGSCLERHEWHKHGTCQANWAVQGFFEVSVNLVRQFNDAGMADFMSQRIGRKVRTSDFLDKVASVLGPAARDRIKLNCNQGMLVEIQLSLSAELTPESGLDQLIRNAPVQSDSNCGATFRVDPIGH